MDGEKDTCLQYENTESDDANFSKLLCKCPASPQNKYYRVDEFLNMESQNN